MNQNVLIMCNCVLIALDHESYKLQTNRFSLSLFMSCPYNGQIFEVTKGLYLLIPFIS